MHISKPLIRCPHISGHKNTNKQRHYLMCKRKSLAVGRRTCCVTVLVTSVLGYVLLLSGCSRQDGKTGPDDELVSALRDEINELKAQVQFLQRALDLEGRRSALGHQTPPTVDANQGIDENSIQLALLDSNDPSQATTVLHDPNSVESHGLIATVADKIGERGPGYTEPTDLAWLKEENRRLKNELARLQRRLTEAGEISTNYQDASQVLRAFESRRSPVRQIDFLNSLAQMSEARDALILPTIQKALGSPDPEVVLTASGLLQNFKSAEALPLIEQALLSRDDEVRINALRPLEYMNDPLAVGLLVNAFNDKSEAVRDQAIEIAGEQEGETQLIVLSGAMSSDYDDVRYEALSLLELRSDPDVVPVIIEGLRDPDLRFVEETNSALSFLIDQEFQSYEDAVNWWELNKTRYDENLAER